MPIRNFEVIFNSKKTQHPKGEVQHKYCVQTTTKGMAQLIAKDSLEADEPDTFQFFKAPRLSIVDEEPTQPNPDIVNEFEEAPDRMASPDEIEDAEYLQADMDEEIANRNDIEEPIIEPDSIPAQDPELGPVSSELGPVGPVGPDIGPTEELTEEPEVAEKIIFENGTYDMPNHVYHMSEGISSSMVKKSCESMMLYHGLYISKEIEQSKGDALRFGNLFHTIVLEPEKLHEEYIVLDDTIDRRTKAGKEAYKIVTETAEAKHLTVVTQAEFDLANEMSARAVNDKYAGKLLRSMQRLTEISYYETHSTTGLQVKVRPDLSVGNVCIDLKSIHVNRSVDSEWMLEHLRREVIKYKYHLSAAMYLEVAKLKEFVWIFVNKAPGYHWVATVRASEELLNDGEELYHTAMHKIFNAQIDNEWPGPQSVLPSINGTKVILPEI